MEPISKAICFAARAFDGMYRKGENTPAMIVAVADPRNGLVRHSGSIWTVEQSADLVQLSVDVYRLPGAVASAVRQPSQRLAYRAATAELPSFIPKRIAVQVHSKISSSSLIATPHIVAGSAGKSNDANGEKEEDFS